MSLRVQLICLWLVGAAVFAGYEIYKYKNKELPSTHTERQGGRNGAAPNPVEEAPVASSNRSGDDLPEEAAPGYRMEGGLQDEAKAPVAQGSDSAPRRQVLPAQAAMLAAVAAGAPATDVKVSFPFDDLSALLQERTHSLDLAAQAVKNAGKNPRRAKADLAHQAEHLWGLALFLPEDADVNAQLASCLNELALRLPREERLPLYKKAEAFSAKAPAASGALLARGTALMGIARHSEGNSAGLYQEAARVFEQAAAVSPGTDLNYARAALAVLTGRENDARVFLEALAAGKDTTRNADIPSPDANGEKRLPYSAAYLLADDRFEPVQRTAWFKSVAESLPDTEAAAGNVDAFVDKVVEEEKPGSGESSSKVRWAERILTHADVDLSPEENAALGRTADKMLSEADAAGLLSPDDYELWAGAVLTGADLMTKEGRAAYARSLDIWRKSPAVRNGQVPVEMDEACRALVEFADSAAERSRLLREMSQVYERASFSSEDRLGVLQAARFTAFEADYASDPSERDRLWRNVFATLAAAGFSSDADSMRRMDTSAEEWDDVLSFMQDAAAERAAVQPDPEKRNELVKKSEAFLDLIEEHLDSGRFSESGVAGSYLKLARTTSDSQYAQALRAKAERLIRRTAPDNGDDLSARGYYYDMLGQTLREQFERAKTFHTGALFFQAASEETLCSDNSRQMWSIVLSREALDTPNPERRKALWTLSRSLFEITDTLYPGSEAYNLACIDALMGNEASAREQLNRSIRYRNIPNRAHLSIDGDMDPVRDKAWFRDVLDRIER